MKIQNLLMKVDEKNTSVATNILLKMLAQAELSRQPTSVCLIVMYFPGFVCNIL